MTNVLIISGDIVDSNMGGVGVRYWEIAHALSYHCQVTLAIPNRTDLNSSRIKMVEFDLESGDLRDILQEVDAIVTHGFVLHFHPYIRETRIPLAIDLYTPFLLESLVWHDHDDWGKWIPEYEEYLRVQLDLLRAGDFFFCASERQRDYWLGWLHAQKRINPHTYRQDPTLRRLIDVVPFGLPTETPQLKQPNLRGVHPGIDHDDILILWSGGLWDWLDPLTLIRAVGQIAPHNPNIKVYFMGTKHPNPIVSDMMMPERAMALSRELGLLGQVVFFGEWVPYQERAGYLLEADLGVLSHPSHIETHFSFRTRVLDCIWTGLPLIITEGDAMAEWVFKEKIGLTVPPNDPGAMAEAINKMIAVGGRGSFAQKFENLRVVLRWDRVVEPLVHFCLLPKLAPDKGQYLTELERISRDKDIFLGQVIHDKDIFLGQVIRDKDTHAKELEDQLNRYRRLLPFRVYAWFSRKFMSG